MPFAANRQIGEIGGVGLGGVTLGQDVNGAATRPATILLLLLHIFTMHNLGSVASSTGISARAKRVTRHHLYGLTAPVNLL